MNVRFPFSRFSSSNCCLLLVMALFHLCLSNTNSNAMLCMDDERQALLRFKHGLIDDGADRLASWVRDENSDCCKWAGIVCNNITGHVHTIHLPGSCYYNLYKTYEECLRQKLRGDLSPSLLNLKQLKHLDLSNNDFGGKQIPIFMGSLRNLKYLNLTNSGFGGTIPPQLGNLSELCTLSLGGSSYEIYESTSMTNMQWLLGLRFLHHLDMSGLDLSKTVDWFQVINTLPSLTELHLSNSQLLHIHPHVSNLNISSLSLLDLSENDFSNSLVPQWIFSIASLVSLDLSGCYFHGLIPSSSEGFHNMTSLELLHVSGNDFMNSSFVLKGLSSSNLISLDISRCGVSSSVLDSLHNLTSILSLDLFDNQLTKAIPKSLGNLCNLRNIVLSSNSFGNISLTSLLASFLECKSPSLELISIVNPKVLILETNSIVGTIPESIGRLSFLKYLNLDWNLISGQIPFSVGGLSSLEVLRVSNNRLNGSLPDSLGGLSSLEVLSVSNNRLNGSLPESIGLLSNLEELDITHNLLTGVVTDAHFAKLHRLKYLKGKGNNLILRPRIANWNPPFWLVELSLSSWDIGPQFPLWLLQQSNLYHLEMSNTRISSTMPVSFWGSFPNLEYLDMSQNYIKGRLLGFPRTLSVLDLSYNQFSGQLPKLSNSSSVDILDLSHNSFVGSLQYLICSYGGKDLSVLNLANNHLSGIIPNQCWEKYPSLIILNLDNNNFSGGIPKTLGCLSSLKLLNICNNKLCGRLPTSLKNLTELSILQLAGNKLVGRIPAWLGTEFLALKILNLRSNSFCRDVTHELCYLTSIQILDLANNNLSGIIPRCFNNFTILGGKEAISEISETFSFLSYGDKDFISSASLVIKGREDTYSTILGLVMVVDLSSNNFSGRIPSELMALKALQSLNLSRNQLTGRIPKKIGDMKSLVSFDVSLNQLSSELPQGLSSLSFLSSFNVSYNSFTGRVPTNTQLQSFDESSFVGNKLCGDPLTESCAVSVPDDADHEEDEKDGSDWGLVISMMIGFIAGFWVVVVPLIVNTTWRFAYFNFLRKLKYMVCDVVRNCWCNRFHK